MIIRFNQIDLDTERYRLSRAGEPLAIEPRAFDLLVYLIENRERVVSRNEIFDQLWNGKVVTDAALDTCLKEARRAIGDSGSRQQLIKTVRGRGYRFIAEISGSGTADSQPTVASTPGLEAVTLPDQPSIAVLPFTNMSGDAAQEHFADGITDEIITGLSKVPGLFVIANNSTLVYKGRAVDIRQVGREQGVRYVLEGGIRKSGDDIRVTAQLIDAVTGHHLWAEKYHRRLDDIFAVQDEISHRVVVELQIRLVTGERSRPWATSTTSVQAWELVSRAKSLLESHVRDDATQARQLALEAIELDHSYPVAWTLLGWSYLEEVMWDWVPVPEQSLQNAWDAVQKALEIPEYPGSYALLGYVHQARHEFDQAIAMCEKAIAMAPGDAGALALMGNLQVELGRSEEGVQNLRRALRLCPFPPAWYLSSLGAGLHLMGDNESAIGLLRQAVQREPDSILSQLWLASAQSASGKLEDARTTVARIQRLEPNFSVQKMVKYQAPAVQECLKHNLKLAGMS